MQSKRSHEGYLLIDNRHAPGVSEEMARASGKDVIGAGVNGVLEAAVLTCSHCQKGLIVQPLRTREREYCRKCDHYICDDCALVAKLNGGKCLPYQARLDRHQNHLLKQQQRRETPPLLLKG
jgi:hypothetical protein